MKINFYLLRGLIREKEHWGDYPEILSTAFPTAKLNYIEIPGTGEFYQKDSFWKIGDIVEFCRSHYDIAPKNGEINLILTISMGGMITSEWLKRYPNDFDGAVLINSSFKGLSPFYKRVKPSAIYSFFKIAITFNRSKKEQKIVNLVINSVDHHKESIQRWSEIDKKRPVSLKNSFRQLWSAATFEPLMKTPEKTNVLILASKGDKLCDYTCSMKIHHRWKGRVRFHESAGHDLPTDDPNWITYYIKEFVQSNLAG